MGESVISARAVLAHLREIVAGHGIELEERDFWLHSRKGPALSAGASVFKSNDWGTTVQLDVDVSLPDRRFLTESFGGVGTDVESALANAFRIFSENSLHVILTAFFGYPAGVQVEVEEWKLEDGVWRAFVGPFGCRTWNDTVDVKFPDDLYARIESAIKASPRPRDIHWFRTYFAQNNGETQGEEWLMDNLDWVEAQAALRDVAWNRCEGYYSIRNFTVLIRTHPVTPTVRSGPDAVEDGLDIALESWRRERDLLDANLYRKLMNAGIDPLLAERIIAFAPIGFSSVFLSGAKLPKTYQLMKPGGVPGEQIALVREEVFVASCARALRLSREEVFPIASRCAIFNVAVRTVGSVSNLTPERLSDLSFTPALVILPRFSPPDASKKPWWKIW